MESSDASGEAARLLESSGLQGGIILLPRASEAALPLALARDGRFVVCAVARDSGGAAALKAAGAAAGALAKTLYVAEDEAGWLAERSVSLLYIGGLTDSDLTEKNRDAWLRLVSPGRGVAILGNASPEALSASKAGDWLKGVPGAAITSDAGGVWAKFRGLAPDGSTPWTHKFYSAANTRIPVDAGFSPPFLPAWYGLPLHLGYWGDTMVSDAGRAYLVWANRDPRNHVSLIAFDIRNGFKLWEKPFQWEPPRQENHAGYYSGRSCLVAHGGMLLMIDGPDVRVLDGETGKPAGKIPGPNPQGQLKWIAREGNVLAMLAGEADRFASNKELNNFPRVLEQKDVNHFGRDLAARDLKTGSELWRAAEEGTIDERELAILNGRIYYYAREKRMACRELATGALLWSNDAADVREALAADFEHVDGFLIASRCLAATPRALYFGAPWLKQRVGLDTATGKLLWTLPKIGRRTSADVLFEDKIVDPKGAFDLVAGTPLKFGGRPPVHGCGAPFAVNGNFFSPQGGIQDLAGKTLRRPDQKSPCDLGAIVTGGVAVSPPSVCGCPLEVQGFRAFVPAQPAQGGGRLYPGAAPGAAPGGTASEADWPTARHDRRRSGSTPASVPAPAPALAWRWQPPVAEPVRAANSGKEPRCQDLPEFLPTQAIAVGETAYFGDAQGTVRALDLKTGAERWSQPIGSKLFVAPAYGGGRVVAGAADGSVYCLDAATGKLAWRFQMAPQQRRVMWYGHLVATWPLAGGVVIQGETVYAVAGFQGDNGVRAAALDLRDGKPVWERNDAGGAGEFAAPGCMGDLAIAGGKLAFASGGVCPGLLDLKTGQPSLVPGGKCDRIPRFGASVAALSDDWVLFGGRRLAVAFDTWMADRTRDGYSIARAAIPPEQANSQASLGVQLTESSPIPIVFDDQTLLISVDGGAKNKLAAFDLRALLAQTGTLAAQGKDGGKNALPYRFDALAGKSVALPPGARWQQAASPFDMVLAANAVLLAHPKNHDRQEQTCWQLSALDRDTGSALWTADLPCRPAWNSLSVTRQGAILAALWDGSVACFSGK